MSKVTHTKTGSRKKKKGKKVSIVIDKKIKSLSNSPFFKKKLDKANELLSKVGVPA